MQQILLDLINALNRLARSMERFSAVRITLSGTVRVMRDSMGLGRAEDEILYAGMHPGGLDQLRPVHVR